MSTPFYVSDSFTLAFADFQTTGAWHCPGPFNMEKTWGVNEEVSCALHRGACSLIGYVDSAAPPRGINMDVWACLYDISIPGPVLIGGQPVGLYFLTDAGLRMSPANLMNAVSRTGFVSPPLSYTLKAPVRFGLGQGFTTPATGGPFQVGALMRFFGNAADTGIDLAYQYFMQGVADPDAAPPPGPTMLLTLPDGSKWAVPAVAVP